MFRLSIRDIWSRKRRLLGTSLAVILGVALLSGTLVLGETLESSFDDLFADANAGTDVVVRSSIDVGGDEAAQPRGLIDASLVDRVAAVEGTAAVVPSIQGYAQIIGRDGEAIGGNGPPTFGGNWIEDPDLNPYRLAEGRAPAADDEVVVNRGAAEDGGLSVGDRTTVRTPDPIEVTVVGLATFGSADGLGPSTFTAFTDEAAERYLTGSSGLVTSILVRGDGSVGEDELASRIGAVLPSGVEAITGSALTQENLDDLRADFLDFVRTFLLVFALVALLVATFSIYNTFSIIVAQRTRESAMLRALGATRRQVLGSAVLESLLVGVVASGIGVAAGLGIATLLKAVFAGFGFELPADGLTIGAGALGIAFAVGVAVTVVAGIVPARRGSRVTPLEALRESQHDGTGSLVVRLAVGATLLVAGASLLVADASGGLGAGIAGLGGLGLLVGLVVAGPAVARGVARLAARPLGALRGVSGRLAAENAARNPRRTSSTAAALMIGVGIVTLITVAAVSLAASARSSIDDTLRADVVVSTGQFGGSGFSTSLADELATLPEVEASTGLATVQALVDGSGKTMSATDFASAATLVDLDVVEGDLSTMASDQLAVSSDVAGDHGWQIGSPVTVTFGDGEPVELTVGAIFERTVLTGNYVVSADVWEAHTVQPIEPIVLVSGSGSVADLQASVSEVAARYGDPLVQTRDEYVDDSTAFVDSLLGMVYVMLALAIVIALMGIANTLSLSIHERVRELGLLRAVGQTRRQLRSMIRWESVLVALLGTVLGVGLGAAIGSSLISSASSETFPTIVELPVGLLMGVLLVGLLAGVVAAVRPARRAARLDVLDAIATE